ncbi:hypothetical protein PR003_g5252 [Phytophthora rubi]|uniref:Uncharacterized protein n=1 Tax=Phytophthora rubi TaxID=129364 RepID=A0A6A4FU54_9STRA|nr:hypothetical protein PR002_g5395 [Phytophthora rubi]KAE9350712.1 hypothetical protein PR003_g5252 [Phytophthora rubi]
MTIAVDDDRAQVPLANKCLGLRQEARQLGNRMEAASVESTPLRARSRQRVSLARAEAPVQVAVQGQCSQCSSRLTMESSGQ